MLLEHVLNHAGEEVLAGTLPCGLRVILNPKPGFTKTFGLFGTNFGSIDNEFIDPLTGKRIRVPDGVAHFLEHKLFEDEHGDVSDRFAQAGATSNARTGYTSTCYIFSCTEALETNLQLLLDFVQTPYFTAAGVDKEKGIIEQEIRMYRDDPDWRLHMSLLEALYEKHPVRLDIAGSVESIRSINPEVLQASYRAYYRPANMVLVLVGNLDAAQAVRQISTSLAGRNSVAGGLNARARVAEPPHVHRARVEERMMVARPKLGVGYKEAVLGGSGLEIERREILSQVLLDCMFGSSSANHDRLYAEGLIDDSFGASYSAEEDFGYSLIGGDTDDPDQPAARVQEIIDATRASGVARMDFERTKNKYLGRFLRLFNSIEGSASSYMACYFRGFYPFDAIGLIDGLTLEDVHARLQEHPTADRRSLAVILPKTES
ncbi:MAG: pitrilysin family protein [Planctomycetota bacterium]